MTDVRKVFAYIRDEHFDGDIPEHLKDAYLYVITRLLKEKNKNE